MLNFMIRNILILLLISGFIANADFSRSDDIVTDNIRDLQWQDNIVGDKMDWEDAINYCKNLNLGGYYNWRLPNINELKSIIDKSKSKPAIVSGFNNTSFDYYWSSTTHNEYTNNAWMVYFTYGNVDFDVKANSTSSLGHLNYVRCVRGGL